MLRLFPLLCLVILLYFFACDQEDLYCDGELAFCGAIRQNDYEGALVPVNAFLQKLDYPGGDYGENSNLEQLVRWLECKTCVAEAEINCFWCLYSNPPGGSILFQLAESGDTLRIGLLGATPHEARSIIRIPQ